MFVRPRPPRKLPTDAEQKVAGDPEAPESSAPASISVEDEGTPSLAFFIGGTTEGPPNV